MLASINIEIQCRKDVLCIIITTTTHEYVVVISSLLSVVCLSVLFRLYYSFIVLVFVKAVCFQPSSLTLLSLSSQSIRCPQP